MSKKPTSPWLDGRRPELHENKYAARTRALETSSIPWPLATKISWSKENRPGSQFQALEQRCHRFIEVWNGTWSCGALTSQNAYTQDNSGCRYVQRLEMALLTYS